MVAVVACVSVSDCGRMNRPHPMLYETSLKLILDPNEDAEIPLSQQQQRIDTSRTVMTVRNTLPVTVPTRNKLIPQSRASNNTV
jgi:hypothetical protein